MSKAEEHKYDDIIDLPHHQSAVHPHMPLYDRAAQFSPFAALTGHDAAIRETARLTERRVEPDEYELAVLDEKLQYIQEKMAEKPEVTVTYFLPDAKKEGGSYSVYTGKIKRIDISKGRLIFDDGMLIGIKQILDIETGEDNIWQ